MNKTTSNTKPVRKPRKNSMFPRTLGETVHKLTKPIMKKHGLPDGLIEQWPRIAGDDLASYLTPISCKRSKKAAGATLILEVLPSHALIAQHASGVIVEKINLHYGYSLIERVQLQPMTTAPNLQPYQPKTAQGDVVMEKQLHQLAEQLKQPSSKE